MPVPHLGIRWFALLLVLTTIGCGEGETQAPVADDVDLIPEMPSQTVETRKVSHQRPAAGSFGITLAAGDRYYFIKTVDQTVSSGPSARYGTEHVELLLSLTIDDVQPERIRTSVRFHRALYEHQSGDRRVVWDSVQDGGRVPEEARPYRGMLDNGFAIWLSPQNKILDVDGLDAFLQLCVAQSPPAAQREFLQHYRGQSTDSAARIASAVSFLDESLALLPFGELTLDSRPFPEGATWSRNFEISYPIPERVHLDLQLIGLPGTTAEISLQGESRPQSGGAVMGDGLQLALRDGRLQGRCTVDTVTGLPISSRIEREFDLQITPLGSQPTSVHKRVVTTFDAWTPPPGHEP